MAVPNTIQSRCMNGSVQIIQGIQRQQSNPILTAILYTGYLSKLCREIAVRLLETGHKY